MMGRVTERQNRPWLGILFMCIACALFPVHAALLDHIRLGTVTRICTSTIFAKGLVRDGLTGEQTIR